MSNDVSSERRVEGVVSKIAEMMRQVKKGGGRIAVVAGPVVVHTGGVEHFCELIRHGYVDVVLAGNALAVHDIEFALSGTSLGIDLIAGAAVEQGHRNHMAAINTINRAGGIRQAVETGVLKSGVMYECVKHGVDYVLAGSIRDDGPLPETVMDLIEAQERYAEALSKNVQLVLMLSSMLHSIGVGNMLPSWVRVVCVDINPAVVTKLSDRGSAQTVGVVTDVGLFLHRLAERLRPESAAVRAFRLARDPKVAPRHRRRLPGWQARSASALTMRVSASSRPARVRGVPRHSRTARGCWSPTANSARRRSR